MEQHHEERDRLEGQISSGGESEEPILSDPQSGEGASYPGGEINDYEFGERDDVAAMDYGKRTTTETETEDNLIDDVHGYTNVPEPQRMDIQSNVVPAPSDALHPPAPPSDKTNDSNRNSAEGGLEPSVGQSSILADMNSDLEEFDETMLPENAQQQQSAQEANVQDDNEGTVKELHHDESESGQSVPKSSPSLTFGNEDAISTSPIMFANEDSMGQSSDIPQESPDIIDTSKEELQQEGSSSSGVISGLSSSLMAAPRGDHTSTEYPSVETVEGSDSGEQSLTSLMSRNQPTREIAPEKTDDLGKEKTSNIGISSTSSGRMGEGSQPGSSAPKSSGPSLPILSSRKKPLGVGSGLPPRSVGSGGSGSGSGGGGSGSGSALQSKNQERAPGLPTGIGESSGLPPRQRPPQPTQSRNPQLSSSTAAAAAGTGAGGGGGGPRLPIPAPQRHNVPPMQNTPPVNNGGGNQQQLQQQQQQQQPEEPPDVVEARSKLRDIRLTMYRIVNRLGMTTSDFGLNEFMTKVDRTEQLRFRGPGMIRQRLDVLAAEAEQLDEQQGHDSDLDMTVTVLVIGLSGSGKTSVIRNLLHPGVGLNGDPAPESTNKITVHTGKVSGIKFNMIDTPGLSVAASALRKNMNILKNVRRAVTKYKPNTIIYVDRLDLFRKEFSDAPVLRLINDMLPELLYNCVALLTRASAPPPNCGQGEMSYNQYYKFRMDVFRQVITYAISDMRWGGKPLGFENHPRCRVDVNGVPILPNGVAYKKQAIFSLVASHLSTRMETVCKTRLIHRRTMDEMMRMMQPRKQLQLSALVSQLLTSKPPKKFPDEESELMTKREIRNLDSAEDKVEEENKRRDYTRIRKVEILQEEAHPTHVPIVGASIELNPSFDHEVHQHRYNATDFVSGWSIRPIISAQEGTFDHDDGVEMFQVAREGVLRRPGKCIDGSPASMIIQAGKGKNVGNVTMETGVSHYATRSLSTTLGAVVHPAGQDGEVVYTPTIDIRAKVTENDKVTIGGMACRLAESGWPDKGQTAVGGKLENKYKIRDGVKVMGSFGAMTVKPSTTQARDVACGGNLELKLAGGKGDFDPSFLFSGGVSYQKKGNYKRTVFSGQISGEQAITAETMLNARLQISAGGSGTASARLITHDKPQAGWLLALPIVIKALKRLLGHGDEFV